MKKKLITLALVAIMAAGAMFALVACDTKKTATIGKVGVEKHTYFPYAVVTIDKDGKATACEIGECFGPSGKAWIESSTAEGQVAYNNPWYPGFDAIVTAFHAAADDTARTAAVADKYISIDGKVFELSWRTGIKMVKRANSYLTKPADTEVTVSVLTFKNKKDGTWLTDQYLAENMSWYLKAINKSKMFPCDASGKKTEIGGKLFQDGALRKNDASTVYNPARGLTGPEFVRACKALADFALEKNFVIEYEDCTATDRPQRIKDFDYQALISQFPKDADGKDVVTQPSSLNTSTYLHYGKSYIETAVAAFDAAKALLK